MWFKSQPKESPDELANRLQQEGRVDLLEQELQRYDPQKLSQQDKESYYHLWGIAAFQKGDRPTTFDRFKQAHAACPESATIRFSLAQEHEARTEIDEMFALFDTCEFPKVLAKYMLAAARYAYLWGRPDKATQYLASIVDAYFQLRIADDTFLYIRGLPFFGQTWSYLVAFAWMQHHYDFTDDLLNRSKSLLSDYNFEPLERFYACHKRSNYDDYLAVLADQLRHQDPLAPSGYLRTQSAALRAVQSDDPKSATAELEHVQLADNDFPWLADILLVHKARLLHLTEQQAAEATLRTHFFNQQHLLFEPDHAYSFAFLDYQETLRPIYQATVRAQANQSQR